jgi:hypothetical protein
VGEFFVLDIKKFAEEAASCADLADIAGVVSAFGADEINIFAHFSASLLFLIVLRIE